jgi:predicted kinase
MIIGKPRSGKTTLARNLAKRLDLVHVSVENWLLRLQEKIKNYEAPDDLEEDQEPPEWLTPLEKSVNEALKTG